MVPRVHIVILNWNGWKDTIECLESVMRHHYDNFQVIVCDNHSQDGSLEKIQDWAAGHLESQVPSDHPLAKLSQPAVAKHLAWVRLSRAQAEGTPEAAWSKFPMILIETGGNLGFAGGNNVGMRYALKSAQCDYVWLLNNDTVIEATTLSEMVAHSERLRAQGKQNTCGSLVCFYDDPTVIQALGGSQFNRKTGIATQTLGRFKKRTETIEHAAIAASLDYITACSWLVPRKFLDEVGLMEESYFLYYEEIDWTTRAGDKWLLTYCPSAPVYHKEGNSIGSKSIGKTASPKSEYFMAQAKLRFMRNFYPEHLLRTKMVSVMQALNRFRQGLPSNAYAIIRAVWNSQKA